MTFAKAPRFPVEEPCLLTREEKRMNLLKRQVKKDLRSPSPRQKLFAYRDPQSTNHDTSKKPKTAISIKTNSKQHKFVVKSNSLIDVPNRLAEKTPCQKIFWKEIVRMKQAGIRFEKPSGHPLHNTTFSNFKLKRDKKFKNVELHVSQDKKRL